MAATRIIRAILRSLEKFQEFATGKVSAETFFFLRLSSESCLSRVGPTIVGVSEKPLMDLREWPWMDRPLGWGSTTVVGDCMSAMASCS